ncbi:hypothetical protein HYU40_03880 [Candidatus Woesearchaeota archaeon]|nr:hypothetical protein [Candidatus Woesearchaeota archaeon]
MAFGNFYLGGSRLKALAARDFSSLLRHKQLLFGAALGLVLMFLFRNYVKDTLVLAALGIIAVFSTFYKRFMRVPPAIELVTFSTVMVGISYGPVTGAIFGAVITLAAEIFNSGVDAFIIGYIPARAIVGAVSAFFPAANIVTLGLWMSVLYNLVAQPLYALQSDAELRVKLLAFVIINISSNFIIFSLLGAFVKGLVM